MFSKEEFSEKVIATLLARYPQVRVKEHLAFGAVLTSVTWPEIRLYFDRPYARYLDTPEGVEQIIDAYLQQVTGENLPKILRAFDEIKLFLLPLLKPPTYPTIIQQQLRDLPPDATPVFDRLTQSAVIVYTVDISDQPIRTFVSQRDLAEWRISVQTLHETAVANLARRTRVQVIQSSAEPVGIFFLVEPIDAYTATRILIGGVLHELGRLAHEDVILAIPSRDMLMAVGRSNQRGIGWMRSSLMPQKFRNSPEPVTDRLFLFRLDNSTLEEWNG